MKKRIGIVGGGQLGRMLAQAARKLGFFVTVLDPMLDGPAGQVADAHIIGSFKDKDKILELADVSDYVTFEIESANAEALEELVARGPS
jgi:5-(carboxyamino)imidazole ribonucleotide synthase